MYTFNTVLNTIDVFNPATDLKHNCIAVEEQGGETEVNGNFTQTFVDANGKTYTAVLTAQEYFDGKEWKVKQ